MTSWDFLDWGLDINKADTDVRIEGLISQLEKEPQDADRDFLMRGAIRQRDGIKNLHTPEARQKLEAPARKWCALDKPRREMYLSILRGVKSWNNLGENHKKIDALHQSVIGLAGSDDEHALVRAMLRLQEATAQFLSTPHAPQRLMSKWKEVGTLQTIWGPWDDLPSAANADANGTAEAGGTPDANGASEETAGSETAVSEAAGAADAGGTDSVNAEVTVDSANDAVSASVKEEQPADV